MVVYEERPIFIWREKKSTPLIGKVSSTTMRNCSQLVGNGQIFKWFEANNTGG